MKPDTLTEQVSASTFVSMIHARQTVWYEELVPFIKAYGWEHILLTPVIAPRNSTKLVTLPSTEELTVLSDSKDEWWYKSSSSTLTADEEYGILVAISKRYQGGSTKPADPSIEPKVDFSARFVVPIHPERFENARVIAKVYQRIQAATTALLFQWVTSVPYARLVYAASGNANFDESIPVQHINPLNVDTCPMFSNKTP